MSWPRFSAPLSRMSWRSSWMAWAAPVAEVDLGELAALTAALWSHHGWPVQSDGVSEQHRLAGTGASEDHHGLAAADVEIDAVEHDVRSLAFAKAPGEAAGLYFQGVFRHRPLLCGIGCERATAACNKLIHADTFGMFILQLRERHT